MMKHVNNLSEFKRRLFEYIETPTINQMTIVNNFTLIREDYKIFVQSFNGLFSFFVITSLVYMYCFAKQFDSIYLSYYDYINISMCIIIIIIYVINIARIKNQLLLIIENISSHTYLSKHIQLEDYIMEQNNEEMDLEFLKNRIIYINIISKNNETLNKLALLNRVLTQRWEIFRVAGFEVTDTSIFSKLFLIASVLIASKELK